MTFTTDELKLMLKNQQGFSGAATKQICAKLTEEIERKEELENLDFEDDCLSCKL